MPDSKSAVRPDSLEESGRFAETTIDPFRLILKGIDSDNAGVYRQVPVYVRLKDGRVHTFCDPIKIVDEMDRYFDWLFSDKKLHPVLIAAEAHTRLVSIHPFVEGNGRTARLIMNLVLAHYGYPPAVIKVSRRSQYLDAIECRQQDNDDEPFNHMLIDEVRESLEIYLDTLRKGIIWR